MARRSPRESAYDDTSGCAIELAVARAMGQYWRAQHHFPARTLRFVMFDAEESGIYGSWHYVNQTINGDLGQITAMINEEQNGIAYPLRFLGKASAQLLPFYVDAAPGHEQRRLSSAERATSRTARRNPAPPQHDCRLPSLPRSTICARMAIPRSTIATPMGRRKRSPSSRLTSLGTSSYRTTRWATATRSPSRWPGFPARPSPATTPTISAASRSPPGRTRTISRRTPWR